MTVVMVIVNTLVAVGKAKGGSAPSIEKVKTSMKSPFAVAAQNTAGHPILLSESMGW